MHKHLIIDAFEKARSTAELEGITNPSKNKLSIIISDYFTDDVSFRFSSKRLRDYFTLAKSLENTKGDINISQQEVINGLCQYLGYDSYQAFLGNTTTPTLKQELARRPLQKLKLIQFLKTYKTGIFLILSTMVLVTYAIKINQQRWMKWNGESFEEASFETDSMKSGVLQLYSEEQINKFAKLTTCDCNTEFFNSDGSPKVWYSKSKGTLECFNSPGLHPETGKTLKPITEYMIRKYVCKGY